MMEPLKMSRITHAGDKPIHLERCRLRGLEEIGIRENGLNFAKVNTINFTLHQYLNSSGLLATDAFQSCYCP